MKKEEILEMSRKENKKKDLAEIEIDANASRLGALLMLLLAFLYFMYEIVIGRGTNEALYSIITIFNCGTFGYRAFKLEKNRKLNTFTSIIWGLLTILLALSYFNII